MRAHGVPALVELRLPALLDFGPEGIVRGTVLLPGHDPSLATILEADGKRHFDGIEFAEVATGKALLLFRPAITDPPGTLVEGARGASVVWLRTVLTELGGEAIESGDPLLFDAPLAAALRKFQAQRALVADGIVTDVTLLNLQSAIGTAGFVPDAGER
jgi:murein L,D-transpeptidase YcbB/YkuD